MLLFKKSVKVSEALRKRTGKNLKKDFYRSGRLVLRLRLRSRSWPVKKLKKLFFIFIFFLIIRLNINFFLNDCIIIRTAAASTNYSRGNKGFFSSVRRVLVFFFVLTVVTISGREVWISRGYSFNILTIYCRVKGFGVKISLLGPDVRKRFR